jgi:hypothetical protein
MRSGEHGVRRNLLAAALLALVTVLAALAANVPPAAARAAARPAHPGTALARSVTPGSAVNAGDRRGTAVAVRSAQGAGRRHMVEGAGLRAAVRGSRHGAAPAPAVPATGGSTPTGPPPLVDAALTHVSGPAFRGRALPVGAGRSPPRSSCC